MELKRTEVAETVGNPSQSATSGNPLPKVKYRFEPNGDTSSSWRVFKCHTVEMLSDIYVVTLELANQDLAADPDQLLDKDCTFTTIRDPF